MTRPEKVKNVIKTVKIEGYNTRFRTFPSQSSEHHGMRCRAMEGHSKRVMWLGTNVWMPLRSLRGNFGFHEK